jgi:DNA-directed RNA polymerase subunit K/omega
MSEDMSFVSVDNETERLYSQNINVETTYSNYFKNERTTRPYITKFEKAKIIGVRAEQLAVGAKANIEVPEYLTDVRKIAENEFYEKKIPFIIRRRLPDGTFEYFRLTDFKNI